MSEVAIHIERVSKKYRIGATRRRYGTLREHVADSLGSLFRRKGARPEPATEFWALKDVSFDVRQGEVVGIIGANGAGKSTLLKILSRITTPTEGRLSLRGRVGSLLEVGTGFHPELTGRENIYLNGAILGMPKTEIERKFDEIVAFSGVDRFVDTPVKRYSSGMYVRLAFGVAAHLEPDILIVDEVLAVGDAAFQQKCLGRMKGVAREGRTVLFVSHNMSAVEALCSKVFLLEQGSLSFSGGPKEAIGRYLSARSRDGAPSEHSVDLEDAPGRFREFRPLLRRVELLTDGGPLEGSLKVGAPLQVRVSFRLENPTSRADIALGFNDHLGQRVLTMSSMFVPRRCERERVGDHTLVCDIPSLTLMPGEYSLRVILDVGGHAEDCVEDAVQISVSPSAYYGTSRLPKNGYFVLQHDWFFHDTEPVEAAAGSSGIAETASRHKPNLSEPR